METAIIIFELIFIVILIIFIITGLTNIITLIPYVPSKIDYLEKIFKDIKKEKKSGTVFDLGCGDGRTLFIAEKNGFHGIGYEHSLAPYLISRWKKLRLKSKAELYFGSFFKADLKKADIVFVYLLPLIMKRLAEKIKRECKPGTIIISSGFEITGLKVIEIINRDHKKKWPCLYYYKI